MTFEKTWGILWSMANGCVDYDEDWCESHHDNCRKCRKEALENLKSAHEEEVNHARKVEYHRGYEDGKKSMNAKKWQLDHDRSDVVKRLRQFSYRPCMTGGTQFNSSLLLGAVLGREAEPNCINDWWDAYDELVRLLATEPDEDPTCEKRQEPEIGTEESVPNLQESPDLTSKEYKELESCLAEAVCDNLMYRTMLNDAAMEFRKERDKLRRNVERFMLYGSKDYIELPKGEDGEHIHIGDVMYDTEHTDEHAPVVCMLLNSDGWAVSDCNAFGRWKSPQSLRHHSKPDPIEDTFREYELGNLTSSEAIEKIREATNVG